MIEPNLVQSDDLESDSVTGPPQIGHAAIDDALLGLADLASAPLSDHHDRLAMAHEALHQTLERSDDRPENAEPR
ncbi:MAG TPA: hypothetical protein VFY56_09355 [Propionibacteriaceae bacterium]|nr:hypothetical protein [Propionibacteriaceae bacterium]